MAKMEKRTASMRTCKYVINDVVCGHTGPDEDFMIKKCKGRQYRMNRCKECEKARNCIKQSTPEARKRNNASKVKRRAANAKKVAEYLSEHPCVDCGEKDVLVLQFDHVRGTKSFMISDGLNSYSLENIFKEIEKCDVRCANCHIRKTTNERDYIPYKMRGVKCP